MQIEFALCSLTMTLTRRKQQSRDQAADPNVVPTATALESGMRFNCDTCSADITHNVRVKCAEVVKLPPRVVEGDATPAQAIEKLTCPDFDLCIPVRSIPSRFVLTRSVGSRTLYGYCLGVSEIERKN